MAVCRIPTINTSCHPLLPPFCCSRLRVSDAHPTIESNHRDPFVTGCIRSFFPPMDISYSASLQELKKALKFPHPLQKSSWAQTFPQYCCWCFVFVIAVAPSAGCWL